jgi:hypothetical protein
LRSLSGKSQAVGLGYRIATLWAAKCWSLLFFHE